MYKLTKELDYNQKKGMKPIIVNQGRFSMNSPSNEEEFELTNCPDPNCYICVTMPKGGYPSASQIEDGRIKLSSYHQKKLANSMTVLLDWIENAADYDCLTPTRGA